MAFKIKIEYETGDSFSSHDEIKIIDYVWKNLEIAKVNLVRIKEHYRWVCSYEGYQPEKLDAPEFMEKTYGEGGHILSEAMYHMPILDDNGNSFDLNCGWVGYFETLYGASIVAEEEDGWSFST